MIDGKPEFHQAHPPKEKKSAYSLSTKVKLGLITIATAVAAPTVIDKVSSYIDSLDYSKSPVIGDVTSDFHGTINPNQNAKQKDTCLIKAGSQITFHDTTQIRREGDNAQLTADLGETEDCLGWVFRSESKKHVDNIRPVTQEDIDRIIKITESKK